MGISDLRSASVRLGTSRHAAWAAGLGFWVVLHKVTQRHLQCGGVIGAPALQCDTDIVQDHFPDTVMQQMISQCRCRNLRICSCSAIASISLASRPHMAMQSSKEIMDFPSPFPGPNCDARRPVRSAAYARVLPHRVAVACVCPDLSASIAIRSPTCFARM